MAFFFCQKVSGVSSRGMIRPIGGIDATHTWVEATAQNGGQACLLKAIFICPLPAIFKVCLVLWFIVGCIEIVTATRQTGIHNGQILIGQGEVDYKLRLVAVEKGFQLLHIVSIHLCGLDVHLVTCLMDILHNLVTLCLSTTSNHKVGKDVSILGNLECCYRSDASGANH